jgi:hypothetical protein
MHPAGPSSHQLESHSGKASNWSFVGSRIKHTHQGKLRAFATVRRDCSKRIHPERMIDEWELFSEATTSVEMAVESEPL